jgi:outer membrane immunogenic protein
MKKYLVAGVSLLAGVMSAASVMAADMPVKAYKATPAEIFNWTGFYIGGTLGGGSIDPKNLFTTVDNSATGNIGIFNGGVPENDAAARAVANQKLSGSTFLGGLHAGYNWQFGHVLAGVEGDATLMNYNKSVVSTGILPGGLFGGGTLQAVNSFAARDLFTLRGRLGLTADRLLVFATGGVAFANLDMESRNTWVNNTFEIDHSLNGLRTGYVVGGGLEYAMLSNWLLRVEYQHVQFGTVSGTSEALLAGGVRYCGTPASPFPTVPTCGYTQTIHPGMDLVRLGVSKKF